MNDDRWNSFLGHVEYMGNEQRKFQAEVAVQISSGFADLRAEWVETRRSINNAVLGTAERVIHLERRQATQERMTRMLLYGELLLLLALLALAWQVVR